MKKRSFGAAVAAAFVLSAPLAAPAAQAQPAAPAAPVVTASVGDPDMAVAFGLPEWICRIMPRMCP